MDTSYVSDSSNYNGGLGRSAERGTSIGTQSDIDVESSVSGQTVTTSKAGSESSSATELDQTDEKIVKVYVNGLINAMVDDGGDAEGFIRETRGKLREYKALRKTAWFNKINSEVNILLLKTYDLDEAIKSVVTSHKRTLHRLFYEMRSVENSSQTASNSDTETESVTDASEVHSEDTISGNEKILNSYADSLLKGIALECSDKSEFVDEIMQLVQEYKAIRQSVMFGKLLTTVKRIMRRGYNVHDAINKAVKRRKFLLIRTYTEERDSAETSARVAAYNRLAAVAG